MPLPPLVNGKAWANEAWAGSIPFVDENGDPVDLTDLEFKLQLRRRPDVATVDLTMATTTGELYIAVPADAGVLAYDVPVERVRTLKGTYHYDLLAWPAAAPGLARVWLYGTIEVDTGVTRDAA